MILDQLFCVVLLYVRQDLVIFLYRYTKSVTVTSHGGKLTVSARWRLQIFGKPGNYNWMLYIRCCSMSCWVRDEYKIMGFSEENYAQVLSSLLLSGLAAIEKGLRTKWRFSHQFCEVTNARNRPFRGFPFSKSKGGSVGGWRKSHIQGTKWRHGLLAGDYC